MNKLPPAALERYSKILGMAFSQEAQEWTTESRSLAVSQSWERISVAEEEMRKYSSARKRCNDETECLEVMRTCGGSGRVDFNAGRDRRTQLENGRAPICDAMRERKIHG